MKKYVFAALIAALSVSAAYAHSPSAIVVTIVDGKAEVSIDHPVSDPIEHFIKLVTLSVNGTEIERKEFTAQNPEGLTVTFDIPGLKTGDKVRVFAVCNRIGDKRQDVTAP